MCQKLLLLLKNLPKAMFKKIVVRKGEAVPIRRH